MKSKYYSMAFLILTAGLAIFVLSILSIPLEDTINVPDGYKKLCTVDMSKEHTDSVVSEFKVNSTQQKSFYLWTNMAENKNVRVEGANNMRIDLLNGTGKNNNMSSSEFKLEPGDYKIIVTNLPGRGDLLIYVKN